MNRGSVSQAGPSSDERFSCVSDSDLSELAANCVEMLRLPPERIPVMFRALQAERTIARERLGWCQHLQLQEDLSHRDRKETYYLRDPDRFVMCDKFNRESALGSPDSDAVISAFKSAVCKSCNSRCPKTGIQLEK